jgi:hypothetical protein
MAVCPNLINFVAELHIHTVLSPCAAVEMIPPLIIQEAVSKGINLLAVTDHNSIANVAAVMEAASGSGITVLPGIEMQTREEIHSIILFDVISQADAFYTAILPSFPDIKNNIDFFGEQFVVDATGEFIRREDRLLIASSRLSLKEAWHLANQHGGWLIPAHVNRDAFGLLPVLGLIPTDIELETLEVSSHQSIDAIREKFPQIRNFHLIQNGDAHMLEEIRGYSIFKMKAPSISEMKKALNLKDGRSFNNRYQLLH